MQHLIQNLGYVVEENYYSGLYSPIIEITLYKPDKLKVSFEDFAKFYKIELSGYRVDGNKILALADMDDIVELFVSDKDQRKLLSDGYMDYHFDIDITTNEVVISISKDNENAIKKYLSIKYFEGDIEALNSEYDDFESIFKSYCYEDNIIEEIFYLYRDMYESELVSSNYKDLENELFYYINKELKYFTKEDNNIKEVESVEVERNGTETVNGVTTPYSYKETVRKFELVFPISVIADMNMDKYSGLSLFDLFIEADCISRARLDPITLAMLV